MLINHIEVAALDTVFAPRCFEHTIRKEVTGRAGDQQIGTGWVVAVTVSADGGSARFSVELPGDTEELWAQIIPKGYTELSIVLPGS